MENYQCNSCSPLNESHAVQITQALGKCSQIEAELVKAQQAGVPVADIAARLRRCRSQLHGIQQVYFPGTD